MVVVYYSQVTIDAWNESIGMFSESLKETIEKLEEFSYKYSPLSDVNQICRRENTRLLHASFTNGGTNRFPIRNIIRIIARLGRESFESKICGLHFRSMTLRCDTFEGNAIIDLENGDSKDLEFRWKWTDFDGEINYDKFTNFTIKENS